MSFFSSSSTNNKRDGKLDQQPRDRDRDRDRVRDRRPCPRYQRSAYPPRRQQTLRRVPDHVHDQVLLRLREWSAHGGIRIYDLMDNLPDHGHRHQHQYLDLVETYLFRNPAIRYQKIKGSRYWFFTPNEDDLKRRNDATSNDAFATSPSNSALRSPSYDPME
jgi:hypothetical protein